jgi:outer membrane protein
MTPGNLTICVTLTLNCLASALVSADEKISDLVNIYNQAATNDAVLRASWSAVQADEELTVQGFAGLLPDIAFTGSASHRQQKVPDRSRDKSEGYNWNVSLVQPLYRSDLWHTWKQSEQQTQLARIRYLKDEQDLILRVSQAYFNVLRAEDTLETTRAEERAVKRQLDQTQQRFEVGLIAQTDVFEARAAYDAARVNRIVSENNVDVALEALRTLTNRPHLKIGKLDKEMPTPSPAPNNRESWVNNAVRYNLNVMLARQQVLTAEESIKIQKSGHLPTLDAVLSYGEGYSDSDVLDGKSDSTIFSIEMNLPFYTGGAISSRVREATFRLQESQHLEDSTIRQTSELTRNTFNTVNTDIHRIEARRLGIISSQSALEATESGYEVGTRNIVDVLDAQRALYLSQRDYLNARYDFIINSLILKQSSGSLNPRDLVELNNWITLDPDAALLPEF